MIDEDQETIEDKVKDVEVFSAIFIVVIILTVIYVTSMVYFMGSK